MPPQIMSASGVNPVMSKCIRRAVPPLRTGRHAASTSDSTCPPPMVPIDGQVPRDQHLRARMARGGAGTIDDRGKRQKFSLFKMLGNVVFQLHANRLVMGNSFPQGPRPCHICFTVHDATHAPAGRIKVKRNWERSSRKRRRAEATGCLPEPYPKQRKNFSSVWPATRIR